MSSFQNSYTEIVIILKSQHLLRHTKLFLISLPMGGNVGIRYNAKVVTDAKFWLLKVTTMQWLPLNSFQFHVTELSNINSKLFIASLKDYVKFHFLWQLSSIVSAICESVCQICTEGCRDTSRFYHLLFSGSLFVHPEENIPFWWSVLQLGITGWFCGPFYTGGQAGWW